jgi:hypothetical protein
MRRGPVERVTDFLLDGSCGAFLAAIVAISALWFWHDINWIFVAIAAAFGFLLAGFQGRQALSWLYELWWWT